MFKRQFSLYTKEIEERQSWFDLWSLDWYGFEGKHRLVYVNVF